MQLANAKSGSVIQGGIAETTQFTIEADGKMFRLLSDTLYQNKIGSMVREVSCNAYDSHVAAGKSDLPFTIHAPTRIEPWFSVIDYGIGLSHEDVTNIFTCFGKSTKTGSNSMVGAFGFGSKTPFAYTSAFTVISVKDGIRNCYSAVIGEDGLPAMNLMDSSETTDNNGVTITVAVETYDFEDFYNEIATQLRYFKVKPEIQGRDIKFENPYEHVFETVDANTYFRRSPVYSKRGVEVVQGGVSYPVDLSQLSKGLTDRPGLKHFIDGAIYSYNPILMFEIGDIAVTPSRESISYDTRTVKNILDRLEYVQTTLVNRVIEKMQEANTIWEKTVALRKNSDLFSKLFDYSNNIWGVACDRNNPYIAFPETMMEDMDDGKGVVRHRLSRYTPNATQGGKFRLSLDENVSSVIPEGTITFIIDDGCGYAASRIRRLVQETNSTVYFFHAQYSALESRWTIENSDGAVSTRESYGNYVQGSVDPVVLAAFLGCIDGGPTPRFLSELEKEERVVIVKNSDGTETVRAKYVPAKAYKFHSFRHTNNMNTFKNYEKDFVAIKKMAGDVAYVIVDNRKVTSGLDWTEDEFMRAAMTNNEWNMPIYAIRETDAEKVKDNPNWIPLKQALANVKNELMQKYKPLMLRYALSETGKSIPALVTGLFMNYLVKHRDELNDRLLRGLLGRYERARKRKIPTRSHMCNRLYGSEMEQIKNRTHEKDRKRGKIINNRYSFLNVFNTHYNAGYTDEVMANILDMFNATYNKSIAKKP